MVRTRFSKLRPFLLYLALVALLSGCGTTDISPTESNPAPTATSAAENEAESRFVEAEVVKVVDSDTIKIKFDGSEETVRMLLIDGPETVHPDKPEQPFGREASNFAKEMLTDKMVRLELDVSDRDKYGRLLAYVWVGERMYNELILERGLARVAYVYPPNVKYVDRFREIQAEAQEKGLGIWSIEDYAREDGFHPEVIDTVDDAPTAHASAPPAAAACESPTIKGNINSKGERIYHVPDGRYYEQTKAEEMFCTEADAVAAGFRKSKQ
ncbi:thermonuclease family protein [Paenibacillus rubinfantis]|uniref:thermonuclease family protein n=1 Tax=Paenibacillus rubinfantis TaxID=1720296 RepID=UPI00073E330C|nr:thermonuclease family protein [Paenibacillus rubinfantis]